MDRSGEQDVECVRPTGFELPPDTRERTSVLLDGPWQDTKVDGVPVCEMEVGVGGRRRVCMRFDTPSGAREMWFTGEYVEVDWSTPKR